MNLSQFDFFDFGASEGKSIEFAKSMFHAKRGLGIDKNPAKVPFMREKGYGCIQADLTQLDLPENSTSFTIISHFLEHVPDLEAIKRVLRSAKHVSRDFIFIQGPFFDTDTYLSELGMNLFWSNWTGHQCHLTTWQLNAILLELNLKKSMFMVRKRIDSSLDPAIHPLKSPKNQHSYDEKIHPPKLNLTFQLPVYEEMFCFIPLRRVRQMMKVGRSLCKKRSAFLLKQVKEEV